MGRTRKPWSKIISEAGIKIRLYERDVGGVLYREIRLNGVKDRKSLEHKDRSLAESQMKQLAQELAVLKRSGRVGPVTLGEIFRLYFQYRGPLLTPTRLRDARTIAALFEQVLGPTFEVQNLTQTQVDQYVAARISGQVQPKRKGGRREKGVGFGTVSNDLQWLTTAFNWAYSYKEKGRRLLTENPLRDVSWPTEKNPKRPVASEDRFRRTLVHADTVDPTGRLRCMLFIARYSGRRENAICRLRASDILLTPERAALVLAEEGMDERIAQHAPHGAIRWRKENDKVGYLDVTPISAVLREALETYMRKSACVGEAFLFPKLKDPSQPIGRSLAGNMLRKAERKAGLPKLQRGLWHPYRRLFAMEGKPLPDVEVARAGGWRNLTVMKTAYQQPEAAGILKVIENVGRGHNSDTPENVTSIMTTT